MTDSNRWNLALRWTALATTLLGACADDLGRSGNRSPQFPTALFVTDEDVPVDLHLLDGVTDPDGDTLTVTRAVAPGHGVELLAGGVVRLTPATDVYGNVDITYDINDGVNFLTRRVIVSVRPVNDAPVGVGDTLAVVRRGNFALRASDIEHDSLSYEVVTRPAHGTLEGAAPALGYLANLGFVGEDAFTFRVFDGTAWSEPATFHLQVAAGSAPQAFDGSAAGAEEVVLPLTLGSRDDYGDPLEFTIVTPPAHGTLDGTAPNLRYTPAADFNGADSLQFSVSDGLQSSNVATVTIQIAPVNDVPVANPQSVAATEDTAVPVTLTGSDVDGNAVVFEVKTLPQHGMLSAVGSTRTYTPAANYHGPDSFTFVARDSLVESAPATVTIDVASVEDPPIAASLQRSLSEDAAATVTLQGSDGDGDAITYTIATDPAHGTLSGTAPALTYTPAANYNGPDSFTYTVSSNGITSPAGTVTLSIAAVNDRPVALSDSVTTDEDTPVTIALQASDVDGQALSFAIVTPPVDGTATLSGSTLTYQPAPNVNGTRSLTFQASDGSLASTATITINLRAVNDPPTTVDDFVMTDPALAITFSVTDNDSDPEGDGVTLDSVEAPGHGAVEIVDGQLRYTPDAGFTGTDVFAYTVVDSHGVASTGNAHVGVGVFPPGAPAESFGLVAIEPFIIRTELAPAVSSDGRFIAFTSEFTLLSDDTNFRSDVYRFDRRTHTLTLVSVSSTGVAGNGSSQRPQLSADGRYVVFESFANNLVADDSNSEIDVFRHDCVTGETVRVSVATGGAQATGQSRDATVSADGNLVAFRSSAFNLIPDDANGVTDIFVRDVTAGTTTRVSLSFTGREADRAAAEPAISGDGSFVAFSSAATNLVVGDGNGVSDVFVRDRLAGTTTRVSVSSTGGEANAACTGPAISQDGRIVSFLSAATNLVGGAPVAVQLYIRDVQAQITTRPVDAEFDIIWGRLSSDGRYVTELARLGAASHGVTIQDLIAGTSVSLPNTAVLLWPVLSGNGRYLVVLNTLTSGGTINVQPNPL